MTLDTVALLALAPLSAVGSALLALLAFKAATGVRLSAAEASIRDLQQRRDTDGSTIATKLDELKKELAQVRVDIARLEPRTHERGSA